MPTTGILSSQLTPLNHLLKPAYAGQPSSNGVDKNALTILNANLVPLPNSAAGCNYAVAHLDPTDPNHCYDAAISSPTYWREKLFRIDRDVTSSMKLSFRYIHDSWNTTVLAPQWSILRTTNPSAATFPTVQNRFVGPGTSLVARVTNTVSPTLVNDLVLSYTDSAHHFGGREWAGRGGIPTHFHTRSAFGDRPSSAPGQCNPNLSADPINRYSAMRHWPHL